MIYMDNGAAEKPLYGAISEASWILQRTWGNPNSAHREGRRANEHIERAKETISRILNCYPDEVHFCSCACEAASWAIKCMRSACYEIYFEKWEHDCVLHSVKATAPHGALWGHTRRGVVSMLANNETGEIFLIPKGSVLRFVDATAAVGHIPVDFHALGCDYLCADAMKFGGIPGAAFLLIKRGAPIVPLIYGNEERGGTPPTALICAMAEALGEKDAILTESAEKTVSMRDYMIEELLKIPASYLNGKWTPGSYKDRLPGNVNISFEGIDGTALGLMLSERGLMTSAGSACTSGDNEPSHVLLAMGVPPEIAKGTIRLTLNEENTEEECVKAARMISECVENLRELAV